MLKEFVEKIVSLAAPSFKVMEDREYSDKPMIPMTEPLADSMLVSTLTGLAELARAGINGHVSDDCFLHVESHIRVTLNESIPNQWGRRQEHISAVLPHDLKAFAYDRYMGQEAFIIGLMSLFVESADRDALVRQVSSISGEAVNVSEDDGISQTVTVKAGIALRKTETVKNIVTLAPYRTFRDVTQPASQFVFRVQKSAEGPMLALFEADGGQWRLEAMKNIKAWLKTQIPEMTIIA